MNQPLRILLVEDNPLDAKLVVRQLQQDGLNPECERVDSEPAFLGKLDSNWDIILSDYQMPGFGGMRALELLKASGRDIPFIIISGTIGEDMAVAAMKLGAADYLLKDRLGRLGLAVSQAVEQGRLRRERTAADAALRESEERFREVIQNIEEVFWMTNVDKSKMLFVSSAYEKIWGRSCESLYAQPASWIDAVHPDDRERIMRAAVVNSGDYVFKEEYRILRPDGSIRWISDHAFSVRDATGAIYRYAGIAVDITERKQSEEALREREKQLTLITNNIPGLISYVDRELRYCFVNASYEKVLKLPREKILGRTIREIIGEDAFARVEPYAARALAGECVTFENRMPDVAGKDLHLMITFVPDASPECGVKGLFALITNVTNIKHAEEALRKSEDQLRQAQKMEAIGQLAGGVAHDFNNQLSIILGYSNILGQQVAQPHLRRFADNISIAAKRSADLTQKLLVFARKGQLQTAPVDLHKLLSETIEMLERSVDKRITLIQRLEADSAVVNGNASQLQNALLNLGINARDAMANGGMLSYETENLTLNAAFCANRHNDIAPGRYLRIIVSDTGCGMSDEVKRHLFEPFFTTKPPGKGTGLGLASVYGMVKQHGGALTVESVVGEGTSLTIYLPLADQSMPHAAPSSKSLRAAKRFRILAVEDEEILRTMLAYMLTEDGHEVHEAEDGKKAVAYYRQHWREIDLVILDMVMPELNGHQTFLALKEINPSIKAVLATGYSLNTEVQTILNDGVLDYLQKPFEPEQLHDIISKVMNV